MCVIVILCDDLNLGFRWMKSHGFFLKVDFLQSDVQLLQMLAKATVGTLQRYGPIPKSSYIQPFAVAWRHPQLLCSQGHNGQLGTLQRLKNNEENVVTGRTRWC